MYTMRDRWEKEDSCVGIYHKSLLYLIHHALEATPRTPILGLDISVEADADLRSLFGLDGRSGARGNVVWSTTDVTTGNAASRSTSHGGFDDDAATMNSVAARVLNVQSVPVPYTADASRGARLAGVGGLDARRRRERAAGASRVTSRSRRTQAAAARSRRPHRRRRPRCRNVATGKRVALCVGIDKYPGTEYAGRLRERFDGVAAVAREAELHRHDAAR